MSRNILIDLKIFCWNVTIQRSGQKDKPKQWNQSKRGANRNICAILIYWKVYVSPKLDIGACTCQICCMPPQIQLKSPWQFRFFCKNTLNGEQIPQYIAVNPNWFPQLCMSDFCPARQYELPSNINPDTLKNRPNSMFPRLASSQLNLAFEWPNAIRLQ